MSRAATLPNGPVSTPLLFDEMSWYTSEKFALPSPTIRIDNGSVEAAKMASFVSCMSSIAPSVKMSSMKYCDPSWYLF